MKITMGGRQQFNKGFSLVEIIVVIVVIAILAVVSVITYQGIQLRSAQSIVRGDLKAVSQQLSILNLRQPDVFNSLTGLPGTIERSTDVTVSYNPLSNNAYSNLSAVQNGVLFHAMCLELIADPHYSVIHAREGGGTQSVVMRCDDNVRAGGILITGWDSRTWDTPVTVATIQNYINSVPYDSWWTDRQSVVRGFYIELMNRFQQRGGTFPVTSFWDPWANQWSGVHKQELPILAPTRNVNGTFCVEAYHNQYPNHIQRVNERGKIEDGACS